MLKGCRVKRGRVVDIDYPVCLRIHPFGIRRGFDYPVRLRIHLGRISFILCVSKPATRLVFSLSLRA